MQKIPAKGKAVALLIGACLLALFGVGTWRALSEQSLDRWLREKSQPIEQLMQQGTDLFRKGQFGEASILFRNAYDEAARADSQAQVKWKDYLQNQPEPRGANVPEQARFGKGLTYFRPRMAEAATGLASAIVARVRTKYQRELERSANGEENFAPPMSELNPALEVIAQGLAASPQNESLRLLKAQIYQLAGDFGSAVSTLNDLLLVNSGSAEAYNQLGLIYSAPFFLNSSEYEMYREKALAMFEKAALLRDTNGQYMPDPQYNLGIYYATPPADKPENALPSPADARKAAEHLQRYLELTGGKTPQAAQVKAILRRLENIR